MAETLTSKQVAEALGIEAKQLRVFLRSPKGEGLFTRDGKAYVFTPKDVAKIKTAYDRWAKAKVEDAARKAAEASTPASDDAADETTA